MAIGPYAGEVRDIKPFYARQMIADGRATELDAPVDAVAPEVVALPAPVVMPGVVEAVKPLHGGKRGRR